MRAGAGDREAFSEFYDRFASGLVGLAREATGDPATALGLVQAVFIEAWRRAPRFVDDAASPSAWLVELLHDRLRAQRSPG